MHARAGRAPVLVAEAFAWGAFLFGPLWLLWQRAWVAAALSAAGLLLCVAGPPALRPALTFGLLLLLGLIGRDCVRWTLLRRGYPVVHVVAGRSEDDALLRLAQHAPEIGLVAG